MGIYAKDIQKLYVAFFNRPADPIGLAYWEEQVAKNGGSSAAVANAFSASQEYKDLFAGKSTAQIIDTIYQNLFGRAAEASGLTYWGVRLENGTFNIGNIATSIMVGAQGDDLKVVTNKATAADLFTSHVDTAAEMVAYSGTAAGAAARAWLATVGATDASLTAATAAADTAISTIASTTVANGSTFTLTTGVDTITGTAGNDTVKAVVSATAGESTVSLADSIDGGAGTDTLTLTVSGAAVLPASEIKNVENIYIKDLTGGNTHSFANVAGEAKVIVTGSTGNTTVTNLDNATVGVQSMAAAANQTFQFKDSAFASGAALNLAVDGAGSIVAGTAATITVGTAATAGAATVANIDVTGANLVTLATSANSIAAANGIKTLNVTGSGVLALTAGSALVGTTLAADLTTLNASANTGGVIAQVNKTTVKVTGGAGNDKISVGGAMTTGASFTLGAGNDQLLAAGGGSIDDKVVVDGGDGVDTVDSALITVANGGIFKNFEKIALSTSSTTTDIELLTGSTVSGLLVNTGDITGVVALNVANNSTVEVTAVDASQTGTLTLGVKGAAVSTTDVINVSFNGAAQVAVPTAYNIAGGTMTVNNVETINVASGGADNTWNQLALTDDKLKSVVITGAKNLDLTFVGTNGTNPTAAGGAVSLIDGSAATGKLNINLANVTYDSAATGFTLKGGTGADTITTNASSATLTGGGGNDKFIVTATVAGTADVTTAKVTSITDLNAGDSIVLGTLTALTKAQTSIATATNLTNAIDLALKNAAVTANTAAWFQYGGNTFVVVEDANDGFGATTQNDVIVKLTGLVDLTNATVAANAITLV